MGNIWNVLCWEIWVISWIYGNIWIVCMVLDVLYGKLPIWGWYSLPIYGKVWDGFWDFSNVNGILVHVHGITSRTLISMAILSLLLKHPVIWHWNILELGSWWLEWKGMIRGKQWEALGIHGNIWNVWCWELYLGYMVVYGLYVW